MYKKVNLYMLLISAVSIIFTALVSVNLIHAYVSQAKMQELTGVARIIAAANESGQISEILRVVTESGAVSQRITMISPDGEILFESRNDLDFPEGFNPASILSMPEVEQALNEGVGQSKRHSGTMQKEVYYSAVLLSDGSVLRVMEASNNVLGILVKLLPTLILMTIIIFITLNVLARKLTKFIVDPINNINVEAVELSGKALYKEMEPLTQAILNQRKVMDNQLIEMRNRANTFKVLVNNMNEGLIVLDKDGYVLSANPSALRIMNISDFDEGDEVHISRLIPQRIFVESVQEAIGGNSTDISLSIGASTKQVFFNPVLIGGEADGLTGETTSGVVIFIVDITEKAKAEKMRQDFSANVSHELKTPLTAILGFSELIEVGLAQKDDINDFAKKIKMEVQRLIRIIESIIKLSEMDESASHRNFTHFNVSETAQEIADRFRDMAKQNNVSIDVTGEAAEIFADRVMIDELLTNLIQNAINYNVPGGKVDVSINRKASRVQIKVSDTGIGVDENELEHIFERFYRVDRSRSKKTGGTGLGLAIVKHIAMYHGGQVKFESKKSVGSVVTVTI